MTSGSRGKLAEAGGRERKGTGVSPYKKKHPTIGSDTRFSDTSVSQSPMTSANTASQHRDLNSTERQVPANGK